MRALSFSWQSSMAASSFRISVVSGDALSPKPKLEQAAKPALIGVHLEKGKNGLLIQGRVRLKSKPEISEISGHGQTGGGGARFDLCALALGDENPERPVPVAAFLHLPCGHGFILLSGAR